MFHVFLLIYKGKCDVFSCFTWSTSCRFRKVFSNVKKTISHWILPVKHAHDKSNDIAQPTQKLVCYGRFKDKCVWEC